MAREADVFIGWGIGPVPVNAQKFFTRDTVFIVLPIPPSVQGGNKYMTQLSGYGWPHPIRSILDRYGYKDLIPQRIGLIGFSESCFGVLAMLQSADAQYIDTVVAIDGIHTSFIGGKPNSDRSNVLMAGLAPWIEYASLAASDTIDPGNHLPIGRRHCIITHSAIVPPTFVSTTQTANIILSNIFGSFAPADPIPEGIYDVSYDPPIILHGNSINKYKTTEYDSAPSSYYAHKNGLYVFGYNNLDPTGINDHIYQAQIILPTMVEKIVAPNWNDIDPKAGLCIAGTASYSRAQYEMKSFGYDTSVNGNTCILNPPVTLPPPSASESDKYLDYNKWIPKDQRTDTTGLQTIQKMGSAMKLFWIFASMGLLYAGTKTVEKVVEK